MDYNDSDTQEDKQVNPTKQDKVYPVTVVAREKKAILVQWSDDDGVLHRASINDKYLQGNNTVRAIDLAKGIRYGMDFSDAFPTITAEQFINALHNGGFWTAEDIRANPTGARSTAYTALQPVYKALFEFIKNK